ncbi:MAG: low molecular weight protein-tyrosine-phosphatase [Rikenellaceae bacterium]
MVNNEIKKLPKSILFVCLGNICRSAAADGVFPKFATRYLPNSPIKIDSAGTYGGHAGDKADVRMRNSAKKRGYDLTSISRKVTSDDFYNFDIIFAMDDSNYDDLCHIAPEKELEAKIFKFADFITRYDIDHVPDPYYQGVDGFEYVLDILEDGCKNICLTLQNLK